MEDDEGDAAGKLRRALMALHQRARQTQNPMYAWAAVTLVGWERQRAILAGEVAADADLTLPGWCADYFAQTAQTLESLARGGDFRKPVPEGPEPSEPSLLSPDIALQLVGQALGLSRPGSNEFRNYRSDRETINSFVEFEQLRSSGRTYAEAMERLASNSRSVDESVLRKDVKEGRRLLKGDRPEDEPTGKT